ncbi:MAG: rhodanese-like domain-containing protein [Anaerolineae bacterium]
MKARFHATWLLMLLLATWLTGCGLGVAPLAADGAAQAQGVAPTDVESEGFQLDAEVPPDVVADLIEREEIHVVDVREEWEYAQGHIPGATLLPLGTLEDRVDEIPTDRPVVLVCRSDNRSGQAQRYLIDQGFDNVHNMTGGMVAWEAGGYGLER